VATEVFKGAMVVKTALENVDDFFVKDVDYSRALVEEATRVLVECFALLLSDLRQVHACTRAPHDAREVASDCAFSWSHLSIEFLSSDLSHMSGAWSRQKGK
jgi:hypothetical protein